LVQPHCFWLQVQLRQLQAAPHGQDAGAALVLQPHWHPAPGQAVQVHWVALLTWVLTDSMMTSVVEEIPCSAFPLWEGQAPRPRKNCQVFGECCQNA
jgi:hypothetical protein